MSENVEIESVLRKKIDSGNTQLSENEILSYVASLEIKSNHPIAKSLLLESERRNLSL